MNSTFYYAISQVALPDQDYNNLGYKILPICIPKWMKEYILNYLLINLAYFKNLNEILKITCSNYCY